MFRTQKSVERRWTSLPTMLASPWTESRTSNPDRKYDMIFVDAFSSDAVPVHLLTRQALQIYHAKLKDNGLILFNISNRYLKLEPVIANIAASEEMVCLMRTGRELRPGQDRLELGPGRQQGGRFREVAAR